MTLFVSEIGLNHLGDEKLAFNMVKNIARTGVKAISMQILHDKDYDGKESWRFRLQLNVYIKIINYLKKKKILFGLSIHDEKALFIFKNLKIDFWKIISFRFYDDNLIKRAIKTKKPVYVSTGIASIADIKECFKKNPKANFLHTTLSKNINPNIEAIDKMKKVKKKIGYSLHTNTDEIIIAALAKKADPIFFYVKNNDKKYYPDGAHAINIDYLNKKLILWKYISKSISNGIKKRQKVPNWVGTVVK
jgi:sialic acid synthase SpsE